MTEALELLTPPFAVTQITVFIIFILTEPLLSLSIATW